MILLFCDSDNTGQVLIKQFYPYATTFGSLREVHDIFNLHVIIMDNFFLKKKIINRIKYSNSYR